MSFLDRVGESFDEFTHWKLSDAPGDVGSAIGGAWSAATNWKVDKDSWFAKPANAISWATSPIAGASQNIVGGAAEALNFAYSYGLARPASTGWQQETNLFNGQFSKLTSGQAWNDAWNRSEEISPGQAIVTAAAQLPGVVQIGPDWMRDNPDPFSPMAAQDREDFFQHSFWGKMSSGSIDALGVIAADPSYVGLKLARKAQLAKVTVASSDIEQVLAKAKRVDNPKARQGFAIGVKPDVIPASGINVLTKRQADQAQRASQLFDRIDSTPLNQLQAMPELRGHEDANSLAVLFGRVKAEYAGDAVERRRAYADILGTAWGDTRSLARLTDRRDELALDMQKLSQAPPQNLWAWRSPDYADIAKMDQRRLEAKLQTIDEQVGRFDEVINWTGQGAGPTRVGSTALERASQASAVKAINETWLHSSLASTPIRVVSAAAGTRIPDHVNIKDAAAGYDDLVNVVRLMHYTPAETKQKLMDSFVRASTADQRMSVVDSVRNQIVVDAAAKYKLTPEQAKQMIAHGNYRMETVRNALKSRLYSAAGDSKYIMFGDPEEDVIHMFDKPFLKSQIEDSHPIIDPREVDHAMKIASRSRLLDHAGRPGEVAADTFGALGDLSLDVVNMATKLWKTSALARGAYPIRIQTDSQFRQAVHMEMQQFLATRYTVVKGVKKYLITTKDGDATSWKNMFTEGNLEESLVETLTRDLGHGSRWNLTREDVEPIARNIVASGGGPADLANELGNKILTKRRTGDFSAIPPTHPDWTKSYLRAVNQQILNSPVALQALQTPDMPTLLKLVREVPELRKEAREVGARFDSQEQWLNRVITNNNYYLPNATMRRMVLRQIPTDEIARTYKVLAEIKTRLQTFPKRKVDRTPEEQGFYEDLVKSRFKMQGIVKRAKERGELKVVKPTRLDERALTDLFKGPKPKVKPMPVHGEGYSVVEQSKVVASYNDLRNGFFKYAADVPETIMARSPLFWDSYRKQIGATLERLDEKQIAAIGVDKIRQNAMRQARKQVGQVLFDSSHSSNMASTMRFMSPFFSAWEDTMTKWSKLFYENPQLIARVNQGSQGLGDAGVLEDQQGNRIDARGHVFNDQGERIDDNPDYKGGSEYILLPKALTKNIVRPFLKAVEIATPFDDLSGYAEGGLRIRKDSINSVIQGEPWWLPGFGPIVAVPTNHFVREMFPKEVDHPILKWILPYGTTTESSLTQLLPKYAKTWKNALGNSRQYNDQYKIYLAEAVINERNGGTPVDLDKIANKTRNHFILKGFVDNLSPVSITPTAKNQFYLDKAREYRADKTRKDWSADYDRDFPGFAEMKLELSANETGIQATDMAWDAQKRFRKVVNADPENGWLYLGPSNAPGTFNGAVYDWQISNGFRTQKKPQEALKDLQAEQGWDKYNRFRIAVNLVLEERGLVSTQQKGAEDLAFAVRGYREILAGENPAWAEAQGGAGGNKPQIMLDKAEAFLEKYPSERNRPDMVALQKYIGMRNAIKATLLTRNNKSLEYNPDLKFALDAYAQILVKDNIGFETMYNRVLEYDNLEKELG
jgi:hypothetical protein